MNVDWAWSWITGSLNCWCSRYARNLCSLNHSSAFHPLPIATQATKVLKSHLQLPSFLLYLPYHTFHSSVSYVLLCVLSLPLLFTSVHERLVYATISELSNKLSSNSCLVLTSSPFYHLPSALHNHSSPFFCGNLPWQPSFESTNCFAPESLKHCQFLSIVLLNARTGPWDLPVRNDSMT